MILWAFRVSSLWAIKFSVMKFIKVGQQWSWSFKFSLKCIFPLPVEQNQEIHKWEIQKIKQKYLDNSELKSQVIKIFINIAHKTDQITRSSCLNVMQWGGCRNSQSETEETLQICFIHGIFRKKCSRIMTEWLYIKALLLCSAIVQKIVTQLYSWCVARLFLYKRTHC